MKKKVSKSCFFGQNDDLTQPSTVKKFGTLRNGECRCHIFNMVETLFDIK